MKERIKKTVIFYICVMAVGIAAVAICSHFGRGLPCIFNRITGLRCGGCGNTTAVLALFKLDFLAAIKANMLLPLEAAYGAWLLFCCTRDYLKSGKLSLMPRPEWVNVVFLVILLLWSVLRNVFGV